MSLPAFERRRLDRIEGDLRAEDGRLARWAPGKLARR